MLRTVLLAVLVLVGASSAAHAATWKDVLTYYESVLRNETTAVVVTGDTVWVERLPVSAGNTLPIYRVWLRRSATLPGGAQYFEQRYTMASKTWCPLTAGCSMLLYVEPTSAGSTATTTAFTVPQGTAALGGKWLQCTGGVGCTASNVNADFTQQNNGGVERDEYFFDCRGGQSGSPTRTSVPNQAGISLGTSILWQFGRASGRTEGQCRTADVLLKEFRDVTVGTCNISAYNWTVTDATALITSFRIDNCGCVPDGMQPIADNGDGTCDVRWLYGDPAEPTGAASGVPKKGDAKPTTGTTAVTGDYSTTPKATATGTTGGTGGSTLGTGTGAGGAVSGGTVSSGTGQTASKTIIVDSTGAPVTIGGGGLSESQTTSSVKDALNADPKDADGDPVAQPTAPSYNTDRPSEITSEQVTALDWKQLIRDWISSSPVVAIITGSGVTVSGATCALSTSGPWGGTVSLDFCPMESMLDLFGVFVFAIAGLYAVLVSAGVV